MIRIRIRSLETADATADVLAAWEVLAFCAKEFSVRDIEMDMDEAIEWYIDNRISLSDRENYRGEPALAEGEMIELFRSGMRTLAAERQLALSETYPFEVDADGLLRRKPLASISYAGVSYLALQFFRAMNVGLIEIEGKDDEIKKAKNEINDIFREIFEFIAGYAISADQSGYPFMLSRCRSSKRLHGLLSLFCSKVGSGEVLSYDHWSALRKAANDGGVDCLVHVGLRPSTGASEVYLVGASVQVSSIDKKIIGRDEMEFFKGFFKTKPAVFTGVLVRPYDVDDLILAKCREKNCKLYSYDEIWKSFGSTKRIGVTPVKRLDSGVRSAVQKLTEVVLLHDYNEHRMCQP